jgi:hypothetical protein
LSEQQTPSSRPSGQQSDPTTEDSGLRTQHSGLRAQLAALGVTLDDQRLDALLPAYTGLISGVRRIAAIDLDETEPALVFRLPAATPAEEPQR